MDKQPCPLCQKQRPSRKFKPLYGTPVCRKCYYGFTNRRQIAYLIDLVLWYFIAYSFISALEYTILTLNPNITPALLAPIGLLDWPLFLIFMLKDGFSGRSLGKLICGIIVVDRDTFAPIGFTSSFKRNLPLIIPLVPLIVAFTLAKGKRLGDGWASSKVIWSKYKEHPVFTAKTYCPKCQYDLRANTSGSCPECGREIDEHTRRVLADLSYDT